MIQKTAEFQPKVHLEQFYETLVGHKRVLLLDFDGTLAPFTKERDNVTLWPGVKERLEALLEAPHTRVVIVTGRSIENIKSLLPLKNLPEIFGTHGMERLKEDGTYASKKMDESQKIGLKHALQCAVLSIPRKLIEEKPFSIAVHFRGQPETIHEKISYEIMPAWHEIADRHNLLVHPFNGGVEIRLQGHSKGDAVNAVLEETTDEIVAYLGDDLTDEDAFTALGDRGLRVLVNTSIDRPSAADVCITPPKELLNFLDHWLVL